MASHRTFTNLEEAVQYLKLDRVKSKLHTLRRHIPAVLIHRPPVLQIY